MSRPSSYHDGQRYEEDPFDSNGFALPLFTQQSAVPSYRTDGQAHLSPPQASGHQHRHSLNYGSSINSPFNSSGSAHGPPQSHHRQQQSVSSGLPYTSVPYPQTAHPTSQVDELMPPATSSGSFGSLARSTSLGARKKDPYSYSSDDVESGLGSMDTRGEPSTAWMGYGGGRSSAAQAYGALSQSRDVAMSPTKTYSSNNQMKPPPVPAYALTRPPPARNDSSGSSPSRSAYDHGINNPYVPQGLDPGPSVPVKEASWTGYRRPLTGPRVPSNSMQKSSPIEQLSPFVMPDNRGISPLSPLVDPYNLSPNMQPPQPASPGMSSQPRWSASQMPLSPPRGQRPQSSQQLYPASQPATPATKKYDMGPPRARLPSRERSRGGTSRQGFREIKSWKDLDPMVNHEPNGRRADPDIPGKYLSVSGSHYGHNGADVWVSP